MPKTTVSRPNRNRARTVKIGATEIGTIKDTRGGYQSIPSVNAPGYVSAPLFHKTVAEARQRLERIGRKALSLKEYVVYEGTERLLVGGSIAGSIIEGPYRLILETTSEAQARAKVKELRATRKRGQYFGFTDKREQVGI
jgi:hypothetical protein